jgi:hypothetical protein
LWWHASWLTFFTSINIAENYQLTLTIQSYSFTSTNIAENKRFFTVHNTTQRSYGRIIGFSLWVKW